MENLNVSKTVFVAFIVKDNERQYLTGSYWGSDYNFSKFSFLKPLRDVAHQGNESFREEDYIVKATSFEEMEEKLKKCKAIPDEQISIVKVEIAMKETEVIHFSGDKKSTLKKNENMDNFEDYFVSTGYAKSKNLGKLNMVNLRHSEKNEYIDKKINNFYKSWIELESLN